MGKSPTREEVVRILETGPLPLGTVSGRAGQVPVPGSPEPESGQEGTMTLGSEPGVSELAPSRKGSLDQVSGSEGSRLGPDRRGCKVPTGYYPMEPVTDTWSEEVPGITTVQEWEGGWGERIGSPSCTSPSSGIGSLSLQSEDQVGTNPDLEPRGGRVSEDLIDWEGPVIGGGHGEMDSEELKTGGTEAIEWLQFCNTATNRDGNPTFQPIPRDPAENAQPLPEVEENKVRPPLCRPWEKAEDH